MRNYIDEIDARILMLLQQEGRIQRTRIAEEVGLSIPSVSERMRKLEERGILQGYYAIVNATELHYDVTAFVRVNVEQPVHYDDFTEQAKALPDVQEVHTIVGEGSHMLKIRTRNTYTLEQLLAQIQAWPGVHSTTTCLVLSTHKETRTVQVAPMQLNHDV